MLLETDTEEELDRLVAALKVGLKGPGRTVVRAGKRRLIRLTGLDAMVTEDEIRSAVCSAVEHCEWDDVSVVRMHKYPTQEQEAVVLVPEGVASALRKEGRVKIGWISSAVAVVGERLPVCFACRREGHIARHCPVRGAASGGRGKEEVTGERGRADVLPPPARWPGEGGWPA